MTDQPEELHYRDVMGELHVGMFVLGEEFPPRDGGRGLSARRVDTEEGHRLIQKFVPRGVPADDPRHDRLDREIRAGTRIGQVYGPYLPDEVVRLFGYNTDVDEPYALFDAYPGQPAGLVFGHFGEQQRHRFQAGLLRALQHTAAAGVVHGAIRMEALWWDGQRLLLTDFEAAERAGEPRRGWGEAPRRSREQVRGHGLAHPGDDIWGAGMVLRELVLGPQRATGVRPDTSADPERLRVLLEGVFGDQAEGRPDAVTLLARLRVPSALTMAADLEEGLRAGRQQFELASARKRGAEPPGVPGVAVLGQAPGDQVDAPRTGAASEGDTAELRLPTRPALRPVVIGALVLLVVLLAVWLVPSLMPA